MVVFMNGKQKRVPRPPTIDGLPVDAFILRNADPIWLHQNEMWEYIDEAMDRVLRAARPGDMTRLPSAASGLRRNCRIAARHPNPTRSR
jgi:hypothetical protein